MTISLEHLKATFSKEKMDQLKELLKGKGAIVGHQSPDGDSIGSCLGLHLFLREIGIETTVIAPDPFPSFLAWLPGAENILIFNSDKERVQQAIANADFVFTLDFNDLSRLGELGKLVEERNVPIVMIDHHQSPKDYATIQFSNPNCGSTSELICQLIDVLEKNDKINKDVAQALYCGIVMDTGSFRFSSVSASTHLFVARLIESGLKPHEVHENIFDNQSFEKLRLLGFALSEKLVIVPELSAAYITLSEEEAHKYNYEKGFTEGLVNYALSVKGVSVAGFFREEDGKVKISFRSKYPVKVNELAAKYFNGGGHIYAAGGKSYDSIENTVALFLQKLPEFSA